MPTPKHIDSELNRNSNIGIAEIVTGLVMTILLFISAGRLTYWQGWLYVSLSVLRILVSRLLFAGTTELIQERANPGPGVKTWDKVIYGIFIPVHISVIIVASLDAGRFGWSPAFPPTPYVIGLAFYVLGHIFNLWAMWSNRFFSSMVRIQSERGHTVVSNGPYRLIRHPGNLGAILLQISDSLVLGSLWSLIPSFIIVLLILTRTNLEDKMLSAELHGYKSYVHKVRYRMIPGIW